MELTYTTEKSEKETIKLFLRRRGSLKGWLLMELREMAATMAVLWPVGVILYWTVLCDHPYNYCFGIVIAFLGAAAFCLCFFILERIVTRVPRRAYRQRTSHKVEYRLTDDALAFSFGESSFSSPWNKVTKKFRIDKNALYLYGKNLPFEAQCIPDWRGHGVGRKELVVALKKAGLKRILNRWLKYLIALVAFLLALTVYIYIGGIEWGDWTIPDEAKLRLEVRDVPDEDNAYVALVALTNVCTTTKDSEEKGGKESEGMSDKDFVSSYGKAFADGDSDARAKWAEVRGNLSSSNRAERILAENAKFFDAFHAALSLKGFCLKEEEGETDYPPMVRLLPSYSGFIRFAELVKFKAQVALERGDLDSAVSDVEDIHVMGLMVSTNCTSMVAYLVGSVIEKMSYEKMCDVVVMGKVSDEVLKRFDSLVDGSEAHAQLCWERAIKGELALNVAMVEWSCSLPENNYRYRRSSDDNDRIKAIEGHVRFVRRLNMWPGLFRFCYHRREMVFQTTENFRAIIAHEEPRLESSKWWTAISPNGAGRIFVDSLCPLLEPYFKERCLNRIRLRLVIAAEKWRRAHGGKNPPTLDALVPDYLAAVPRDPWCKSGEPIKYDTSLGVAWSVGKEGKYDYRKVADEHGNKASVDNDTQKYAFSLDGKPIAGLNTVECK